MKKALKWIAILLIIAVAGVFIFAWSKNEAKPTGEPSAQADAMAQKMLRAIDKEAWDTTHIIQWSFPRGHDFLWDKSRNFVKVIWPEGNEVLLNTKKVAGKAFQNGKEITGEDANKMVQEAWSLFCNDSFWLNAPAKAFDPGTERSIVTLDDGREGLMVNYKSGGVTPGDAYVWILDENGLPKSYKMWVSIIPVGGMEFTWEDWQTTDTGAKIAGNHKGAFEIPITNVKGANDLASFGLDQDPFSSILSL